jgi:malate dehydrogenase (oxaloacetate-decarboxylating)
MKKFREVMNASGKVVKIQTCHKGKFLMSIPELNKGIAFSLAERAEFGLQGKLPDRVESLQDQVDRYYKQYAEMTSNLLKNVFLNRLRQHNNVVFYALAMKYLTEMMPIVYTPTIAEAVENHCFQFDLPRGLYFSYSDKGRLHDVMKQISYPEVDLIIITDGEGVLGIGDWGIGGIDICIGKLMVYTLCGGINPRRVLPIQLDVGTNNQALLDDPMYLGLRKNRVQGDNYDDFIDEAVRAITTKFPNVFLHWEDFGRANARRNLLRFRQKICTFNDDMQGTGATAVAAILSGLLSAKTTIEDSQIVIFGAGTAGVGIADQLVLLMLELGMSRQVAEQKIWLIDRQGLLMKSSNELENFQLPYACADEKIQSWQLSSGDYIDLFGVVNNLKPNVLIGCSGVAGAFTEKLVKAMLAGCDEPLIYPLSNPSSRCEALPSDLVRWSDGKAIIATGSPFGSVSYNDREYVISQCNNAFIFPGLGLGIIASQATQVTDGMLSVASRVLSQYSPARKIPRGPVLPSFDQAHAISKDIAIAVAEKARAEGVAGVPADIDFAVKVEAIFWRPEYIPYEFVADLE